VVSLQAELDRSSKSWSNRLTDQIGIVTQLRQQLAQAGGSVQELTAQNQQLREERDRAAEQVQQITAQNQQLREMAACREVALAEATAQLQRVGQEAYRQHAEAEYAAIGSRLNQSLASNFAATQSSTPTASSPARSSQDDESTAPLPGLGEACKLCELDGCKVICILNKEAPRPNARQAGPDTKIFEFAINAGGLAGTGERPFTGPEWQRLCDHVSKHFHWYQEDCRTEKGFWYKVNECWIGVAGFSQTQNSKFAERAVRLGQALLHAALCPNEALTRDILMYFHGDLQTMFTNTRDQIRAELAFVQIDVPVSPSASEAKDEMIRIRPKLIQMRGGSWQDVWLPVHLLRWSQKSCSSKFTDHNWPVFETARELWVRWPDKEQRDYLLKKMPALEVVLDSDGLLWSMSNRRLTAYKMVQALVPDAVVVKCQLKREDGRFEAHHSTLNRGLSIEITEGYRQYREPRCIHCKRNCFS